MLLTRKGAMLRLACIVIYINYGYTLATKDKIQKLRENHFQKRLINSSQPLAIMNNTKREYVYYPEGGHRGHFHGHFHDFGHMHGFGEHGHEYGHEGEYAPHGREYGHCDYGHEGYEHDDGQCCDDDEEVPEYTHTHHVVRYHHHIGKIIRLNPICV